MAANANMIRIGKQGTQTCYVCRRDLRRSVTGSASDCKFKWSAWRKVLSSARFKDAIKPMDNAVKLSSLKPVTFRYKEELDPEGIPQFGLVAEEVEKVNADLITRDEEGNPLQSAMKL